MRSERSLARLDRFDVRPLATDEQDAPPARDGHDPHAPAEATIDVVDDGRAVRRELGADGTELAVRLLMRDLRGFARRQVEHEDVVDVPVFRSLVRDRLAIGRPVGNFRPARVIRHLLDIVEDEDELAFP